MLRSHRSGGAQGSHSEPRLSRQDSKARPVPIELRQCLESSHVKLGTLLNRQVFAEFDVFLCCLLFLGHLPEVFKRT